LVLRYQSSKSLSKQKQLINNYQKEKNDK